MDSLLVVSFNKVIPKMFWQANKEWLTPLLYERHEMELGLHLVSN